MSKHTIFALCLTVVAGLSGGCGLDLPVDSPAEMVDRAAVWDAELDKLQKRAHGAAVAVEALCQIPATKPNCDVMDKAVDFLRDEAFPRARVAVDAYRQTGVGGDKIDTGIALIVDALDRLESAAGL